MRMTEKAGRPCTGSATSVILERKREGKRASIALF